MRTITTIILLLISIAAFSQKTYLKVYKDDALTNIIMYPPGTEFELRNQHGYIVLKYSEAPRKLKIENKHKLIVFPDYKKEKDIIHLNEGLVELALTSEFDDTPSETIAVGGKKVTAQKILSNSTKIKGKKNLIFTLDNGIVFRYTDGNYYATLGDEYLDITGKYVIKSDLGILRLSFSPNNGQVWWYFEATK